MRPSFSALLLVASACATAPAERPLPAVLREPAPEAPLRLRFQPLEGPPVDEVARLVLSRDGAVQARVELRLRSTFSRLGTGWRLTQEVTEASPAGRLPPLQLELTPDGTFVRLLNGEEVAAALQGAAAGETPEALEARVRGEWEARYGQLLGRNLRPGDTLYSVDGVPAPTGGTLSFVLARTVVGTRATPRGEALVLALRCLGAAGGLPQAEVEPLLEAAGRPALEQSVACEGEQLLGTGAFLPLSTRMVLTARPRGGGGAPVVVERSVELTDGAR